MVEFGSSAETLKRLAGYTAGRARAQQIQKESGMQAIFKEITAGDIDVVRQRLAKDPSAVTLVATATPKKYAGQSPLMVALRAGKFEIAELLLDHGADVDFVDSGSPNAYSRPVLHDAITAAVLRTRPGHPDRRGPVNSSDTSFATLSRVIESGANFHVFDSNGNSCLHRAVGDAEQVLPSRAPDEPLDQEFTRNLDRIFDLIFAHGADPNRIEPVLGRSVAEFYGANLIGRFLRQDTTR